MADILKFKETVKRIKKADSQSDLSSLLKKAVVLRRNLPELKKGISITNFKKLKTLFEAKIADILIQKQLIDLLSDLQQKFNLTYLFISHNLKIVRKISHKIAVMYKGKIVEMASTDEIFSNPLHPYTKELLSAAIDYKAIKRESEIKIDPSAQLVDRGNGHFVMDY